MSMSVTNSGSDSDPRNGRVDEMKRKRMESNRESARRSRMRKQKQLADLIGQTSQLKNDNGELVHQINDTTKRYDEVESDNRVLRARLVELSDRLQSLNSVLHVAEEVSGLAVEKPEIPDMIMKAWQLPCPAMAPTEMLHG